MLVVASVLFPAHLCRGFQFRWHHHTSNRGCRWICIKPSSELCKPETISDFVVIDPCSDFGTGHLERPISGEGYSYPRLDNVFNPDVGRSKAGHDAPRLIGHRCVIYDQY
jgi:hypothetical protein